MPLFTFQNGVHYKRADVLRVLGFDPPPKGGPFVNGYFEYGGAHFIFSNVGNAGRTGHYYQNFFDGEDLVWTGRNRAVRSHPSIQRLTAPGSEVHIFFRVNDRDKFIYVGQAYAVSVDDEQPVGIRWRFVNTSESEDTADASARSHSRQLFEGAMTAVLVNRYERSPVARALCISHFGPTCQACHMSFEDKYGAHGEGFIHVHHIVPVSKMEPTYQVDPVRDLIPLCPNCHAMIHRGGRVLPLEELKEMLRRNNDKAG